MKRPATTVLLVLAVLWMFLVPAEPALATADLALTVEVSPTPPQAGKLVSLIIGVANGGPDSAANVVASGGISSGLSFCSFNTPPGTACSFSANSYQCQIATLAKNENTTIVGDFIVLANPAPSSFSGFISSSCSATADPDCSNNSASVASTVTPAETCIADADCSTGETCVGGKCQASCPPLSGGCGDSSVDPQEDCDDGNTTPGDGCSGTCTGESGYVCATPGQLCTPVCGDGGIVGGESCDDGNTTAGDGCGNTSQEEPGFTCTGEPSSCSPACGDGSQNGDETDVDCGGSTCDSCTQGQGCNVTARRG